MKKEWLLIPALALTCTGYVNGDDRSSPGGNEAVESPAENDSDRQITQQIQTALAHASSLSNDAKKIKVATKNGIVTLQGVVDNNNEQDKILNIVGSVRGITRLNNLLTVKSKF